jgi:curved DNA-binding protein
MNQKDYYKILDVNKNSTPEEIKKSYRKLSMKYHPDKNKGEDSKMKEITEAYSILGDTNKKKEYDLSKNLPNPEDIINMFFNNGANIGEFNIPTNSDAFSFFSNLNSNMFNNNFVRPLVHKVYVTLEDVYNGSEIKTTITREIVINNNKTNVYEEISINVPKNILDNDTLILKNKGNVINNNKGDLKIKMILIEHNKFTLYNNNIIYNYTISLKEALCGFILELSYLNNKKYKINNTNTIISPSFKKEINNMGLLKNGNTGKLIIVFTILFPKELTEETKTKIKELL